MRRARRGPPRSRPAIGSRNCLGVCREQQLEQRNLKSLKPLVKDAFSFAAPMLGAAGGLLSGGPKRSQEAQDSHRRAQAAGAANRRA